jgi:nitrate reductase cytochrome c-type subunit
MNQSYKKMKRLIQLLSILTILAFVGTACEKGDTGPAGPAGPAGANGEDGIDGTDGTAGCIQCHTGDENMQIKEAQWASSGHVEGTHMGGFYGSRDGCADCHSSQGFQQVVASGEWGGAAPSSPLPANCFTCHQIHETYTPEDWTFRVGSSVDFLVNGYASNQGNANTCIQCHQSRIAEPILDLTSSVDVEITSSRYGPHHGPQGNMMAGAGNSGAYELDGTLAYNNSMHAANPATTNCTSCHMASQAGGGGNMALGEHSNNVGVGLWEDGTKVINANGCVNCHTSLTDNASATEFVSTARDANLILIDNLFTALFDLGYVTESGSVNASSSSPLVVSPAHAAAIYNYKFLTEDQSTLIHNSTYAKALLQNSIEALQ